MTSSQRELSASGWWAGELGLGTPRTQAVVEGLWPVVHRLLKRRLGILALAQPLCDTMLPYFAAGERRDKEPPFTLLERQASALLAVEPSDRLRTRKIDGEDCSYCSWGKSGPA
jgi:hypothetical protein